MLNPAQAIEVSIKPCTAQNTATFQIFEKMAVEI